MVKDIVKILLIIAVTALISYLASDITIIITMFENALNAFMVALALIIKVIGVPFNVLLQKTYIRMLLSFGVLMFVFSYLFKYLTGHHLEEDPGNEEEINEEVKSLHAQHVFDEDEYLTKENHYSDIDWIADEHIEHAHKTGDTYELNHYSAIKNRNRVNMQLNVDNWTKKQIRYENKLRRLKNRRRRKSKKWVRRKRY